MMKITKDDIVWGFWQKQYTCLLKDLSKVILITEGIGNSMINYVVVIRSLKAKNRGGKWSINESLHSDGDGMRTYKFNINKNSTFDKMDLMLYSVKKYIKDVYMIDIELSPLINLEQEIPM